MIDPTSYISDNLAVKTLELFAECLPRWSGLDLRAQGDKNIHYPLPGIGDSMVILMDIYLQDRGLDQPFNNERSEQRTNIVYGTGIYL